MSDEFYERLSEIDDPYSVYVVPASNVIKFPDANNPNKEHTYIDEFGLTWFEFTCSYKYEGVDFVFSIWATSKENASDRIVELKRSALVDGQILAEIDA